MNSIVDVKHHARLAVKDKGENMIIQFEIARMRNSNNGREISCAFVDTCMSLMQIITRKKVNKVPEVSNPTGEEKDSRNKGVSKRYSKIWVIKKKYKRFF